MKITAKEFNKKPEQAYKAADKGEPVTINHDRYKDIIFVLSTRDRGEKLDDELKAATDPGELPGSSGRSS